MSEDYEEFISLTLRTRNSKKPLKNARKNLETPMAPAMPCKTSKKCEHGETRGKTNEFKSKLACILEASESTRLRMEESLPNYHEDHIAGKEDNSLQHYNLGHKFIPMPQAARRARNVSLENRYGSCKVFFHVPRFVDQQSAARSSLQCCLYISATSTPRKKASPRSSFSLFVPWWFLKKLTWLQEISMARRGVVAAETFSLLLTKPLLIVPCLCHRAPHHCGDPAPFGTTGQTSADFSNHRAPIDFGKWTSTAPFPFLAEPLVCVQPIKVAITKHGFISTLLAGAIPGPEKMIMNGTFLSKNDLQIAHTGPKSGILAKSWVIIRFCRERATTCASLVPAT